MRSPYESLEVWRLAHELALQVYKVTKSFPAEERFGLVAQLRRAAVAIPVNLAEGNARNSPREYLQFCYISRGSLAEVRYLMKLSHDLGFLDGKTLDQCHQGYDRVGKMLHFLVGSIRQGRAK